MGKKATSYLIYIITIYSTLVLSVISLVGWLARLVDPSVYWLPSLVGLALMPVLIADFILLVFWLIRWKLWAIAPAVALIMNFGFIAATVQVGFQLREGMPHDLKVASYNVHNFSRGDFKTTVESIAEFLKTEGVEVVCFQEFKVNKAKFNMDSIRKVLYFMPHVFAPDNNGMGQTLAIFSKYPITNSQQISFPDTGNSALWVDLDVNGKSVRLLDIHFQTTDISQSKQEIEQLKKGPAEPESRQALYVVLRRLRNNFTKRAAQVKMVRAVIDNTAGPIIVCGDFNDTPASYVYAQMTNDLNDGFKSCGNGYAYTYNGISKLLRIDYALYSDDFEGVRYYSSAQSWSDHNPVLLELSFRN